MTARARPPQVLVVGDSLAVGTEPYLGTLLRYREIEWNARAGRTTPEGLQALRASMMRIRPQTVIVSLGTNDGPDPRRFADRIRRTLAAVPATACVVWATIHRPPRKGAFGALNAVLRSMLRRDPRLVLVRWERAVETGRVRLPDGLHPDAAGYLVRSRMIAAAVYRGCGATAAVRQGGRAR